ncbi:GntR family transcriptional regulator [Albidovulum sediminicola]|uniref:GntR family transcriptional regulator n=1 Tax=Albidovulum sediminicola TaxID=2984331 RepID=A0ABT2Z3L1_9RHOB|nr:GntR family transcriptional regulator [Defluviimonas sp. WL0075]MCV2865734.1 GntR family transcriptional regulator [Defluviimonas sp. WL0075]
MTITDFLDPKRWLSPGGGPLYVQLRKRIEAGIAEGVLAPDTPLPPEREVASLTELSRVTVRKAIAELVDKGLVVQRQGSGSFIAAERPRVEQSLSRLTSFTEDMARRGLSSVSQWLERGLFLPSPEEVLTLGLGSDDQVSRLARLRLADGRPMAVERASLPPDILPNPLAVTHSLYEVLGQAGLRPVRAIQKISAVNLTEAEAAQLGLPAGAAGLRIERISYLPEGRVAEFTRSLYRGDAYDFVAELRIPEQPA